MGNRGSCHTTGVPTGRAVEQQIHDTAVASLACDLRVDSVLACHVSIRVPSVRGSAPGTPVSPTRPLNASHSHSPTHPLTRTAPSFTRSPSTPLLSLVSRPAGLGYQPPQILPATPSHPQTLTHIFSLASRLAGLGYQPPQILLAHSHSLIHSRPPTPTPPSLVTLQGLGYQPP